MDEDLIPAACDTDSEKLAQLTATATKLHTIKNASARRIVLDAMSALAISMYPVVAVSTEPNVLPFKRKNA